MRVALVVFFSDNIGGATRRLIRVYGELCKENKNILCDIIAVKTGLSDVQTIFQNTDCAMEGFHILKFKRKLTALFYLLCTNKYQVVHSFGMGRFFMVLEKANRIKKKKNLLSICGYPDAYGLQPERLMKRVRRQLHDADYVDLLYPAGETFIKQYTLGKLFITPGTFTNLKIFRPIEKEKKLVFAAARLEDNKNPMLLLRAVHLSQDHIRSNGYRVIVLGKGEYKTEMESYIQQNDLDDIIQMVGYERTSRYLPSAEIFLSLQRYENYPSQSLVEAVACGCYSIITDVGDSRKCANEEFAAFVEENASSVAREIIRYFGFSEEEKRKIVSSAREFALQNYSIEKSKDYYRMLIEQSCM